MLTMLRIKVALFRIRVENIEIAFFLDRTNVRFLKKSSLFSTKIDYQMDF